MAEVPGSVHEIDSSITHYQQRLSMLSRSDPRRPLECFALAQKQMQRYKLSNTREDLDRSISHFTESILLPSLPQYRPTVLDAFFFLSSSLSTRAKAFKQPEDAIYAAKYLSHLRDQPHESPSISRHKVTALLIEGLAWQIELKVGNVMQNIREMAVLSRELLNLGTSEADTTDTATRLILFVGALVLPKLQLGAPDQPLDELIEFLRAARKHRPDLLEGRLDFAIFLVFRYWMTSADADYEEAACMLDEVMAYKSPGNTQDKLVSIAREYATNTVPLLAMLRSSSYRTPEYLEEAIYRTRTWAAHRGSASGRFPSIIFDPEVTAEQRFYYFGTIEGAQGSSSDGSMTGFSQPVPELLGSVQIYNKMESLLLGIRNSDNTTTIEEAIEETRSIVASDLPTELIRVPILAYFGNILFEAYGRTNKIEYLDESIDVRRQLIGSTVPQAQRFVSFPTLAQSLVLRTLLFPGHRMQDLDEAMELFSQYVSDANPHAHMPHRLQFACNWAHYARLTGHHSISTAYKTTLSLMQDILLFSPTVQLQHVTLAIHDDAQSLPLDYASYQVGENRLEEAIETLEGGRALLWSEMRHLRASIDQLVEVDPDLGHKFAAVNRDLEELTKSVPPSHKLSIDDGATDDLRAVDPFGRLVLKQRALFKERVKLISQIQALPGFDGFLASPSFDILRSAALSGPVIIINHSRWRSDILVLLHNMPPSLITTPHDFYKRTIALKDKLLDSRQKHGLDSKDYDDTLTIVLAELYTLVGKPVIDRLHQLQVPEQSRIWWCTTSVFCSLPLHAMGPIPSEDGEPRYFLDLYICSYTPTLSALIQSRHRDTGPQSLNLPSILLVAQLDPSLPTVKGEIQVVQALGSEVSSLISEAATPAAVIDGFRHHQIVHFACHGTLETGKPFEAGFELHRGQRLTMLEIVRSHLPAAEFAFLSACHTAEVTEGSVMDEGLHLAAAVQYCGFRSVVGTMWAMADTDGRDLAKYFYKSFFSESRGVPYHERSSKALRFAVKKLRRKRGITLERWVNFVHYGA